MAAPGKSSRWSSFLSQAIAGVESRLDNILTETGDDAQVQASSLATIKASPANSRSYSSAQAGDRLQARLTKAISAKTAPGPADDRNATSHHSSTECASIDTQANEPRDTLPCGPAEQPMRETAGDDHDDAAPREYDASFSDGPRPSNGEYGDTQAPDGHVKPFKSDDELDETRRKQQEEIREYLKRIDSLQSKIQYLSKNAADAARQPAANTPSGSMEKKLADKDEKIALFMQEGQKLSGIEQKLRATIKRLRVQASEHEVQIEALRKNKEKTVADAENLRSCVNGSEQYDESNRAMAALQQDIISLKWENSSKDEFCHNLEHDMKSKIDQAEATAAEALTRALASEQLKQNDLQDTITSLQTDKKLMADKARQDNIEWEERLQRIMNRSRVAEEELRLELRSMETKLEAMRTTAEEASSGGRQEAQVKMFRQFETLQSQYTSAQENWQGIETSLLAKAANLERERQDAQRRESEMQKKARDAANRCRHLENELQELHTITSALRQELESCRDQQASKEASCKTTEEALEQARVELEKERQRPATKDGQFETEPRQWVDELAGAKSRGRQSRPDSPLLPICRTFSSDLAGCPTPGKPRRNPTPAGSMPDSPTELLPSVRRVSGQPSARLAALTSITSGPPLAPSSPFEVVGEILPAPSPTVERDNGTDDTAPSPRNMTQDMVSASTVAAGPSIQLVERMSAAIRRLEAEKLAAKEEMARVCNQRDEARADMVIVMKELEEAKAIAGTVPRLEKEVSDMDSRYQTTLEMLGEKSELVEELKADVQDVKVMYRELVECTVK